MYVILHNVIISLFIFITEVFFFIFEKFIIIILGVVKRNPLFLHEIEWKNNGFFFTTPNIFIIN